MKSLWSTVSFLSVVHLLALLMFIGWLAQSDRLSMDRLHQLRDMFEPTVTDAESAAEAAADEASRAENEAFVQAKLQSSPRTSEQQVRIVDVVRRLEETGGVVIMGRGGESNILV